MSVQSRRGQLPTQAGDVVLSLTSTSSWEEAKSEDLGEDFFISLAEVTEVEVELPSDKAPEVDKIFPEMLKALDIMGLSPGVLHLQCHMGTDYINFCVDCRTVKCYPNNKPWVTKDIKAILNEKKRAFRDGNSETLHLALELKQL